MAPYETDARRMKSMKHDMGVIEFSIDALFSTRKAGDEAADATCLRLPVARARTLMMMRRQQLAAPDKPQPCSRLPGRA